MKYRVSAYSDIGGRKKNEDAYVVCQSKKGILAVVADGLGGCGDGEMASGLAITSLKQAYEKNPLFDINRCVEDINKAILHLQNHHGKSMKTTVAIVRIEADHAIFAHVGDTRIYAFKNGQVVFQSRDHSVAQMSVQCGEIAPDQIRNHPDRNMLTRALGGSETVKLETTQLKNDSYDAVLICSDGFWEYIFENEMSMALQNNNDPEKWLEIMKNILSYRAPIDNDNNTAIIIMKQGVQ